MQKVRVFLRELSARRRASAHRGNAVECPCCGGTFARFMPFGEVKRRPDAQCPSCGCLERHRTLWLYLLDRTQGFARPSSLLHVAPKRDIPSQVFEAFPTLQYVSIDLDPDAAMVGMDLTRLTFPDSSFDLVLCNHVLEHVDDDRRALAEIRRVLRPGGWALLQSPVDWRRETTLEDRSVTAPDERARLFGQSDHVRRYGLDYSERLAQAGFEVTVEDYTSELQPSEVERYRLSPEHIHRCVKPLG